MNEMNRKMIAGLLVSAIVLICIPMAAAGSTVVSIEDVTVSEGETVRVPIRITDVTNMCGANIWLSYNTSVVSVEALEAGDLGSVTSSKDNENGIAKMAWDTAESKTGDFVFVYVTLKAVGCGTSPLDLDVRDLYECDDDMTDIEHSVQDGTFKVSDIIYDSADTNHDCVVSMMELMAQIGKWKSGDVGMMELMTSIGRWKLGSEGYC